MRKHLLYLRRHYRVLHLETALAELYTLDTSRQPTKDRRTPLVLTFDDGYYDNYIHGFALAQELQVPITIFLVPDYIESGKRFWWQEPEYLLHHTQVSKVTLEGCTYCLDTVAERKALTQAIDMRIRNAPSVAEREQFIASVHMLLKVEAASSATIAAERAALPVTWAEVREMEQSGWVSFGAHTMHHPILAYLADPGEIEYEVQECKLVLERQLGHPVATFAYPVGQDEHIGEHAVHAVQQAGYNWAVTAIHGFNSPQSNPYLLRRVDVDIDQHWLRIAVKACGLWAIFTHLCQLPITLYQKGLKNKR